MSSIALGRVKYTEHDDVNLMGRVRGHPGLWTHTLSQLWEHVTDLWIIILSICKLDIVTSTERVECQTVLLALHITPPRMGPPCACVDFAVLECFSIYL